MKNRDELREELEEFSPFLKKMKDKDEGFRVPKDYFKSLPDEVLNKIKPDVPTSRTWADELAVFVQRLLQPKYALALATAVVLVVAAVCIFDQHKNTEAQQPVADAMLEAISDEALQNYVSENIGEFDRELILETQYAGKDAKSLPELAPQPGTDELEQYLDDIIDEIDLDDLEEML
jgi:hypothetical protein